MAPPTHFELNTGAKIPAVGLGMRQRLRPLATSADKEQALGDLNLVKCARQSRSPLRTDTLTLTQLCKFLILLGSDIPG